MAQFRLRLITPNNDRSFSLNDLNAQETFLASTITNYSNQQSEYKANKQVLLTGEVNHTTSYSYNEKISLHKHGQKELTFNIDDKIFSNNEWIENPYARILRVGTQLELIDKYNNCLLFTVSKVAYQFNNTNITYTITCQDSFTYQLTRQNQGYTLQNDDSSSDFIGALDIDNWTNRIVKDCYLTYQYVPLDTGIYQDTDGLLHTFEVAGNDLQYSVNTTLQNVSKIIKPIYNKQDYNEFYETVPFSTSSSSALAALISLGDLLGLQLNVIEGLKYSPSDETETSSIDPAILKPLQYTRFFFFGPTKNNETTGLTYSPLRDIQDFSLSFSGEALTTVLNVKSTTWNEEEIGLLPKMPDFFISQILTDTSWTKSKYYPGYFLELIKGPRFSDASFFDTSSEIFIEENQYDEEIERSYTYLVQINRDALPFWTSCYNQIACSWDKDHITQWDYNELRMTSKTHEMGLATENPHPDLENFYSLYNIWRYVDFNYPISWNYTNVYQVRIDTPLYPDQPQGINFNADFEEYTWSFKYLFINWICTLIKQNNNYYIYVLKETSPGLYQAVPNDFDYEDFINDFLFSQRYILVLPPEYQGIVIGDPWALYSFYPEGAEIPASLINEYNQDTNTPRRFYFYIKHTPCNDADHRPTNAATFLRLTRKYSQEEWDFAIIAESCPWLENKLIDFDYFYKLGIISRAEYENLIDFITNDLRIINGQLMCYATAYYQSLHKQTKILAELQAATDQLGAIFYADIVEPYGQSGASKLNTGDFAAAYNDLFNLTKESDAREPMLRLNSIISDYFNKYFSAEQRFLKNIYNFRKFFSSQNVYSLNGDAHLQDVTYSIITDYDNTNTDRVHVGFNSALQWTKVDQDSPITLAKNYVIGVDEHDEQIINTQYYTNASIYQWQHGHYVIKKIPGPDNYQEFYVPLFAASQPHQLDYNVAYNPKNTYFLKQERYRTLFGVEDEKATTITYNEAVYIQLDYSHIVQLFLYNNPNKYYIRDTHQKIPLEWIRCNCATVQQAFSIHLWNGFETLSKYISFLLPKDNQNLSNTLFNTFWSYYKAIMPFNSIYVQDFDIQHKISDESDDLVTYTWTINDENHHPYKSNGNHTWLKYDIKTKSYDSTTILTRDDLYTAWYEVSMINFKEALSTIFGTLNASSSSIVNLLTLGNTLTSWQKAAGYYTKTEKFDWSVVWSNVGRAIVGFYPIGWNWPSPWYAEWVPADKTDYSVKEYYWDGTAGVFKEESNKNEAIPTEWTNNNYLLGAYTKYYSGDSIWANYTKSVNAEKEIQELTESLQSTGILNQLYQITTDTRGERYPVIAWKHYDNYYSKIIATHNLGSWTHDNNKDLDDSNYFNNSNVLNSYNAVSGNNLTYRNMFLYDVHTVLDSYASGSSNACHWDKFWTTNKYARFCVANDLINPTDKYIWVKACSQDGTNYIYFTDSEDPQPVVTTRFSAIKFYPLVEGKEEINMNTFFSLEELNNNKFTIQDLFNRINELDPDHAHTWNTSNSYLFKVDDDENNQTKYAILHIEPYEKGIISNSNTFYNNPTNYNVNYRDITGSTIIYELNHNTGHSDVKLKPSNLTVQPFMTEDTQTHQYFPTDEILVLSEEDTQLVQVKQLEELINQINENRLPDSHINYSDPWINDIDGTTHWYETSDSSSRTFTLKQAFNNENEISYYFLGNNVFHTSEFNKNNQTTAQTFSVFVTKYHIDENDTIIIDNSSKTYAIQFDVRGGGGTGSQQTSDIITLDDLNIQVVRTVNEDYDISQMSNGELWYRFHNRLDIPQLLEKVVVIETELTNYWTQAYTASQYCEWFLPPTWTIEAENNTNYFSGLLYTVQRNNKLELINNILPDVEIYSYGGKTLLPAYIYHYTSDNNLTPGDMFIEDTPYLKNNPAIINAINHILSEENSDYINNIYNFTAQENGVTTYYYVTGGGLHYKDVLHTLNSTENIYPRFDGLYVMQLSILLTKYVESSSTQYETLLDKKLTIWRHLYARFPGIFLENTYENKDARSSTQLLQMAQLAFKDYTSPEKQYNITVIDAEVLDGYSGQELRIGDGILLKSSDYYDAVDETYRALNQYLFISDISYTLRQDTDIALTVNTIKYQDKLLQSIVKLIR